MADVETMPERGIGDNQPANPFDALKAHIDDLDLEARNHLDGEPIASETQATAVSRILDDARKAAKAADEARKDEKRPHDDAGRAVQVKWQPLIGQAELAASTAKQALAPWLEAQEAQQREIADEARKAAEEAAEKARKAAEAARPDDLAGQTTARVLQENAAAAAKTAGRLGKAKPLAAGGSRAIGLRSIWTPALTDPVAALRHYRTEQPEALKAWLLEQAEQDVRAGKRAIPGFTITEGKVAQ